MSGALVQPDIKEALELLDLAEKKGINLRLLGGMAIRLRCPSSAEPPFLRESSDFDFAARGPSGALESFFAAMGWSANEEFNLLNGRERLVFSSPLGIKTDVFVDSFRMCHSLPLAHSLGLDPLTLPLAELFLTKAQVVEANAKDLSDAACILADHELGPCDGESLNLSRMASLCASDWGLWKTTSLSLEKIAGWTNAANLGEAPRSLILRRLEAMAKGLSEAPKSKAWRLRSIVGERIKWYDLPEEGLS